MRPFAAPTAGWPNSRMPRRIVPREAPVALATAAWPPRPGRRRLSGKHQPPHPLVHNGGNRLVTSLNRSFNYHPLSISEHVVEVKLFRDSALNSFRPNMF